MNRLTLFGLLLFTGCYDSAETPVVISEPPAATTTLTELRRLYVGKPFEIATDILVSGYVTSHDRAGNFYHTFVVEAEDAAIEVMAGIDGLHNIYPEGYRIVINLNGLVVGESRGLLQIGRTPETGSGYVTGYIGSRAALDRHVFRSNEHRNIRPFATDIPSLTPSMVGRLVRIDGLRCAPEELEEATWSGNKRFVDADGNALNTYTRAYADFATKEIPLCEVMLVGILQCDVTVDGDMRYTLKLRDEKDCWY